jgi:FkbM family methyltransferase
MMRPFRSHRPVRIKDRFGNALWCPSVIEPIATSLFASGVYEPDTLAAILANLNPGGVYLDVGANVGALALPVAALRSDARVICVEADPEIAAMLRRNVAENLRKNVTVVELLAGAKSNVAVPFYRAPAHKFGMGSVGPQFSKPSIPLVQRPLDDVLNELGVHNVDIVKLDIEGAELGALRGLRRRLTDTRPPAVILEFADWAESRAGYKCGEAQELLRSFGFRIYSLRDWKRGREPLSQPMTVGYEMLVAVKRQPRIG